MLADPKLSETWRKFELWLRTASGDTRWGLAAGVQEAELDAFEREVGFALPASVRTFWRLSAGQEEPSGNGLLGGFDLLSPKQALAQWKDWHDLRESEGEEGLETLSRPCTSSPKGAIGEEYTRAGWIPLWREAYEGNYIGVDLDPGPDGVVGQVIGFGRDEDEKHVLFWDYADAIAWLAEQARSGHLTVQPSAGAKGAQSFRASHGGRRILSVFNELAQNGELPLGTKPKTAPRKPEPAPAQVAKSPDAEPVPVPLPGAAQAALDDYVGMLLVSLKRARCVDEETQEQSQPPQVHARSHQHLDSPRDPRKSAVTGTELDMEPCEPVAEMNTDGVTDAFRNVAQRSLEAGLVLRQIEVVFERDALGQWRPRIHIESFENYQRLKAARRSLDRQLGAALVAFANQQRSDWSAVTAQYELEPLSVRPEFTVIFPYPRPVTRVPAPPEIEALFEQMRALHVHFGRTLHVASVRVAHEKIDTPAVDTFYG